MGVRMAKVKKTSKKVASIAGRILARFDDWGAMYGKGNVKKEHIATVTWDEVLTLAASVLSQYESEQPKKGKKR